MINRLVCMCLAAVLPASAQVVNVETKPVAAQAVQVRLAYVSLVRVPGDRLTFPYEYAVAAPGYEGKLPQAVLIQMFRYSDQAWGVWADGAVGEPYTSTTAPIRDGDWIVFEHQSMIVYSDAEFEKTFKLLR